MTNHRYLRMCLSLFGAAKGMEPSKPTFRSIALLLGMFLLLLCVPASFAETKEGGIDLSHLEKYGIEYREEHRTEPRPLAVFAVSIDMKERPNDPVKVVAVPAPQPEKVENAEAILTNPLTLAEKKDVLIFLNTNPFAAIPGETRSGWYSGQPVDVCGTVVSESRQISPEQQRHESFWVDHQGKVRMGAWQEDEIAEGVAGFARILKEGMHANVGGNDLHPRSAVGYDSANQKLWFLVVDGRQNGYSEGVTTRELADLLLELGCSDGINLDGGGSSVLIVKNQEGKWKVVNRPPGYEEAKNNLRPVPVGIGIQSLAP